MGYSAGAYYAADSTRLLQKADFDMASLVLCYPWTTGLDAKKLEKDFPPTLFILSGQDPISQNAKNIPFAPVSINMLCIFKIK